jgi:hypothetical protein
MQKVLRDENTTLQQPPPPPQKKKKTRRERNVWEQQNWHRQQCKGTNKELENLSFHNRTPATGNLCGFITNYK